ncbi:hypothetical protein AGMMS50230_22090 [Spirochaetia bacterium]|nr:hypothetical protein AGMMS50230_22090 [Spirochaetia bacterium]
MEDKLFLAAEEYFGIKANEDDLEKFREHLVKTYGLWENPDLLNRVFHSGEAASFLTVNETYFFREPNHFQFLRELLPLFNGTVRICSAASSTGCEAYSIAALLESYNRFNPPVRYSIDAFDINPRVIKTAEGCVYGKGSFRDDGSSFHYALDPFMKQEGDSFIISPSLKKNIRFFVHNIMDPLPAETWDLIFFRNAFIYFSRRYRERVLSNLAAALAEPGFLIMGVSETAGVHHSAFDAKNRGDVFYFQKAVYRSGNSL